jgi:hypothetical protein
MSSIFIKDGSQNSFKLTLFLPEKHHPPAFKGQLFIASNVVLEKRDSKYEGRNGINFNFIIFLFLFFIYFIISQFFLKGKGFSCVIFNLNKEIFFTFPSHLRIEGDKNNFLENNFDLNENQNSFASSKLISLSQLKANTFVDIECIFIEKRTSKIFSFTVCEGLKKK